MKSIDTICIIVSLCYLSATLWTFTLALDDSDFSHDYNFADEGQVLLTNALSHVCIDYDFKNLNKAMRIAHMTIKHINEVVNVSEITGKFPHIINMQAMLLEEHNELVTTYEDIVAFYTNIPSSAASGMPPTSSTSPALSPTSTTPSSINGVDSVLRTKRQLGLAFAGVLGLIAGATLNSYLDTTQIDNLNNNVHKLEFREDKMVHLIAHNDEHIRVNDHKISGLQKILELVVETSAKTEQAFKIEGISHYAFHLYKNIKHLMSKYVSVIQSAAVHRLAAGAISNKGASAALEKIRQMAAAKKLTPVISNIAHFHEVETTWVKTANGFRLFVHCDLYDDTSIFRLHRFYSLPITLTVKLKATIAADHELLALGTESSSGSRLFTELTSMDLEGCRKVNNLRICPRSSAVLRRDSHSTPAHSCLLNLFFSRHASVLKTCQIFFRPPANSAVSISKSKFLVYSKSPTTYDLICAANNTKKIGLQLLDTQLLSVPEGCLALTPDFVLRPQSEYFVHQTLVGRKWTLPPRSMWSPNLEEDELHAAYEKLVNSSSGLATAKPITLDMIHALTSPLYYMHPPSIISLSVCAVVLILVSGIIFAICKAYRKENLPTYQPPAQIELYPMLSKSAPTAPVN